MDILRGLRLHIPAIEKLKYNCAMIFRLRSKTSNEFSERDGVGGDVG